LARTTKIDAIKLRGASGTEYVFRVYVWETRFKSLPAVYAVASRNIEPGRPASYDPVFVGTADDLSEITLADHPRSECFQMYLANVVAVLREEDAAARERIAADLIAALAPPCNSPDEG
jgi:hypothetical protein